MTQQERDRLERKAKEDADMGRLPQSGEHYWLTSHTTYADAFSKRKSAN